MREYPTGEEMERAVRPWHDAVRRVVAAKSLPETARFRDQAYERAFTEAVATAVAMAFADDLVEWQHQYHYDAEFHHRVERATQWVSLLLHPEATLRRMERPDPGELSRVRE